MGSIVLQSTRTDGLSDWAKDTGGSLDATEETEGLLDEVKETDKLLGATEMEAGGRLEDCVEGQHLLKGRCHAPNWFSAVNMDKDSRRTL